MIFIWGLKVVDKVDEADRVDIVYPVDIIGKFS